MAHLTIGELTSHRSVLRDHRNAGLQRLSEIQTTPGYNESMLRFYEGVLPHGVLENEIVRLRDLQNKAMRKDPIAAAWTALARAYQDDDVEAIRRWEATLEKAGARRHLRMVQGRNASYRARGFFSGLG